MHPDMEPDEFIFEETRKGKPIESAYGAARERFTLKGLIDYFFDMPWLLWRESKVLDLLKEDGFGIEGAVRMFCDEVGPEWTYRILREVYPLNELQDILVDYGLPMRQSRVLESRLPPRGTTVHTWRYQV